MICRIFRLKNKFRIKITKKKQKLKITIFAYLNKKLKYSCEFLHRSMTALSSNTRILVIKLFILQLLD